MSNWKYTNASNRIVGRINADGSSESCIVEAIADWLAAGNTPEPADPIIVPTPPGVTMRQARLALLQFGLLATVNAAVAAASETVKIEWEFSSTVERERELVQSLVGTLGLTEAQLDDLFTLAATL